MSRLAGAWLLLVTGGGPTEDEPDVKLAARADPAAVSHAMTIRVPAVAPRTTSRARRGAQFLSPPKDWGAETRCSFRDPDRHLFRTSEAK